MHGATQNEILDGATSAPAGGVGTASGADATSRSTIQSAPSASSPARSVPDQKYAWTAKLLASAELPKAGDRPSGLLAVDVTRRQREERP